MVRSSPVNAAVVSAGRRSPALGPFGDVSLELDKMAHPVRVHGELVPGSTECRHRVVAAHRVALRQRTRHGLPLSSIDQRRNGRSLRRPAADRTDFEAVPDHPECVLGVRVIDAAKVQQQGVGQGCRHGSHQRRGRYLLPAFREQAVKRRILSVSHALSGIEKDCLKLKGFSDHGMRHGSGASIDPKPLKKLAIPAGFEPATHGVEIRYSIQLSYGTVGWPADHSTANMKNPLPGQARFRTTFPHLRDARQSKAAVPLRSVRPQRNAAPQPAAGCRPEARFGQCCMRLFRRPIPRPSVRHLFAHFCFRYAAPVRGPGSSIMIGLVRATALCATLALGLVSAQAADKAFKRDDLADSAIKLEAQIKSEAGAVAKTSATLRTDADAAFKRSDFRTGLQILGQIAATAPDDSGNWLRLARTIFQIRSASSQRTDLPAGARLDRGLHRLSARRQCRRGGRRAGRARPRDVRAQAVAPGAR